MNCIICNKKLSYGAKKYCIKCYREILKEKGLLLKGKNNPRYIDGRWINKRYCIDCKKILRGKKSIRCYKCNNIFRWKDMNFKKEIKIKISLSEGI